MCQFFAVITKPMGHVYHHSLGFTPVTTKGIHPFLAAPVAAKFCTFTEMKWELTLSDLYDIHEIMLVQAENERRAVQAIETKIKKHR